LRGPYFLILAVAGAVSFARYAVSLCKRACFTLQYGLFHLVIWVVLQGDMAYIAKQNAMCCHSGICELRVFAISFGAHSRPNRHAMTQKMRHNSQRATAHQKYV